MDDPAYQNFRNLALIAAESRQDTPLTEEGRAMVETRLEKIRPLIRDQPNHPSYHLMILEAIRNLNGGMGSSEEAISNFIKRIHKNLPWAHSTFLKYHLNNLCGSGKILITHDSLYALSKDADNKFITSKYRPKKCYKLGCTPMNFAVENVRKLEEDGRMEFLELDNTKFITSNYQPKKSNKLGRTLMNSAVEKVRKLEEDGIIEFLELDKPPRQPIILRLRFVSHKSDTTGVEMSCSDPNPKPESMVVPHPKISKGKEPCPMVQLGRGRYNKRKTTEFSLNLDKKELGGPTTRPHGNPPSREDLADEFEALQLGEETNHKLLFLPPKEPDVGTRTDGFKPSIPTRRRSKRPPRCTLKNNGEPRVNEPSIPKPRVAEPRIAELIPEGVIIALPALAAQVRQRDPRKR